METISTMFGNFSFNQYSASQDQGARKNVSCLRQSATSFASKIHMYLRQFHSVLQPYSLKLLSCGSLFRFILIWYLHWPGIFCSWVLYFDLSFGGVRCCRVDFREVLCSLISWHFEIFTTNVICTYPQINCDLLAAFNWENHHTKADLLAISAERIGRGRERREYRVIRRKLSKWELSQALRKEQNIIKEKREKTSWGRKVGSDAFDMLEGQINNPSTWNVCVGAYLSKTDTRHLTQLCTISGHKR